MPPEDELPSLWLYGEMEPWRRGRIILVSIATFYALLQALVFFLFLFAGSLEIALVFAIGLVLRWLGFAFIWFGTHWVRWLLGASTLLSGFIYFIWGIRDQSALQWSVGVLDLFIGAFCFAPSVHFFARHQKEQIRWPEKLVVVAIFFLLAGSVLFALLGIGAFTASVREEAEDYGRKALRRVFAENDTVFLLDEANAAVMERYGRLGLSGITIRFPLMTNARPWNSASCATTRRAATRTPTIPSICL
jgi:hypothetical protein